MGDANPRGSEGEAGAVAEPVRPCSPALERLSWIKPRWEEGNSILEAVLEPAERAGGSMLEQPWILRDEPGSARPVPPSPAPDVP